MLLADMSKRKIFPDEGLPRDLRFGYQPAITTPLKVPRVMVGDKLRDVFLEPYNFKYCADAKKYQGLVKIGHGSFG